MISKKQQELDLRKWYDSEAAGHDKCGSYDYCAYCNNEIENPCDKAYEAMIASQKAIAAAEVAEEVKEEAKPVAKKTPAKKASATTAKKPAAKKTAAKKTATKKAPAKKEEETLKATAVVVPESAEKKTTAKKTATKKTASTAKKTAEGAEKKPAAKKTASTTKKERKSRIIFLQKTIITKIKKDSLSCLFLAQFHICE